MVNSAADFRMNMFHRVPSHTGRSVRVDFGQRFQHEVVELHVEGLGSQQLCIVPNAFQQARLLDMTPNVEHSPQVEFSDKQSVVAIE